MTTTTRQSYSLYKLTRQDIALAGLVFLLGLALYVRTLAPSLLYGDGAEFQTLAYTLGMTHPTGYPIYLLVGKLFTLLPFGDIAYRVNLMSAVFGALTLTLLYLLGRMLGGRRIAALLGPLVLSANWIFWSQAVMAELYTMAAALFTGILLLILLWRQMGDWRFLFVAGLLGGLSVGVHNTVALAAPAIFIYLLLTARRRDAWLGAIGGTLLGSLLTLAAFVLLGSINSPTNYYNSVLRFALPAIGVSESSFDSVFEQMTFMLSGRQFHRLMFSNPQVIMVKNMDRYWEYLLGLLPMAGIIVAALGLVALVIRRWREGGLVILTLLTMLLFIFNYNIFDLHVFCIPSFILLALATGYGVATLQDGAAWLLDRIRFTTPRWSEVGASVVGLLFILAAGWLITPPVAKSWQAGQMTFLGGIRFADGRKAAEYPYPVAKPDLPHTEAKAIVDELGDEAIVLADWHELYTCFYIAHIEQGRTNTEIYEVWNFPPPAYTPLLAYIDDNIDQRPIYVTGTVARFRGVSSTLGAHYGLKPINGGKVWQITAPQKSNP